MIYRRTMMKKLLLIIPCVALCALAWIDPYADRVGEGNKKFHGKKYDEARKEYDAAARYAPGEREKKKLRFNHGGARYMQGDYEGAADEFREALKSEDRDVQKKALFNMGNAYLKKGDVEQAVKAYIGSLAVDPNYLPAKKNIEYLLMKKDPPKDGQKDKKGDGSGDDKKDTKDRDKKGDDNNDKKDSSGGGQKEARAKLTSEQLKNILDNMKNNPVRRQRGKGSGVRVHDKDW